MTFKFSPIMLLIYWILLLELLQHDWKSSNVAFSVASAIKGTSQLKIYKELGFESVKFRRWFRCLCFLYKSRSTQTPKYLFNIIPSGNCIYNTQNPDQIETCCRNILCLFKYSFHILSSLMQIKVGQWSITANLWPLNAYIYYVMIIVTSGFSKESVFY